jgi:antitoxin MazE
MIQMAKWGNSLAVRIPRTVIRQANLHEGEQLEIEVLGEGKIVLKSARRRYDLDELVSGITEENRHDETGWGDPRGREVW